MKPILVLTWHRGIKMIPFFLFISCLLMATACKKELKAGAPTPLTYDKVYLIGDATPVGWTIAGALPMTQSAGNSNEFTWTGPLTAGEIKFPTALNFSSDTFGPATASQLVNNNKAQLSPSGSPDVKWKLTSAEAGNYKITLNTQNITVSFQKQ